MFLESDNFIIDKLQIEDKDNLRILEESRPWAKTILAFNSYGACHQCSEVSGLENIRVKS